MNADQQSSYFQHAQDYELVEKAIIFIENSYASQPSLQEIAAQVGMSEFHFQRIFSRWVGISPKRFMQFLTKEHACQLLDQSASILEAALHTGLSGPGRLHDLLVSFEAVTPGEYKNHGAGLLIKYGFHPTPFGECLLAITERGICELAFVTDGNRDDPLLDLRRRWYKAELVESSTAITPSVQKLFSAAPTGENHSIKLYLNGTNFQVKVWEALLQIPPGSLVTYEDIAVFLGKPGAARAVGQAVATNPIAYIIPCHRVIRKVGLIGGYRWGAARKKAMLGWEMAHYSIGMD